LADNPFTPPSISGYNTSPPADDGTVSSANKLGWSKHKDKLTDPIKTLIETTITNNTTAFGKVINTDADQNNAMAGSLAFTPSTLTIASGSVEAKRANHLIAAQTSTTDDLANITTASVSDFTRLFIKPDSGDTITVKDTATGAGEIHLQNNADFVMSGNMSLLLERRGADWYELSRDEPILPAILQYQEQQTSGTTGPAYTAGAWRKVPLNTEVLDAGGHGSVASDQVTLAAGTYEARGRAVIYYNGAGGLARLRIYNAGDSAVIGQGVQNQAGDTAVQVAHTLEVESYFTLTASKAIELQIYPKTGAGTAVPALTTGEVEVYAELYFRKVA